MPRIEEATLFRPDSNLKYPGRAGGGSAGGSGGGGGDEEDGPGIAVGARVGEAARSTRRRKGLSFVVMMICGALTVLGAVFAPRSYEVDARVLVQHTPAIGVAQPHAYVSPEEARNQAREYEEQVMARDNILAIVKQQDLVGRWDAMRPPHRRLIDTINRKLGSRGPSDDAKLEALVASIEQNLKVSIDATTVTVRIDWPEPQSARDIVDAAVKNFLDARFQSEVGVIPARLELQKTFVAQAHNELEAAATELARLQKPNDPRGAASLVIPQLPAGVSDKAAPANVDPQLQARLDDVRGKLAAASQAKNQRSAELNQQLIEKQETLGPAHPDVQSLKDKITALEGSSSPHLTELKAQEQQLLAQLADQQRAAPRKPSESRPAPRFVPGIAASPAPLPETGAGTAPKTVQHAQVRFDTATATYQTRVKQLQELQVQMQTQEAQYKNRYRVTHPAELPAGPKRPVALIAFAVGILATLASVLLAAGLADRFSGIFFEPRDVRDRLGLPVMATFS